MKKGKEFYFQQYEKVMKLHKKGLSLKDIASKTDLSYSAVYNWIIRSKAPKKSSLDDLIEFLRLNGPSPVIVIKELFPSHDDLYHNAQKRGFFLRRYSMSHKKGFGKASVWYYIDGQEEELKRRVVDMIKKYKELKERLINVKK